MIAGGVSAGVVGAFVVEDGHEFGQMPIPLARIVIQLPRRLLGDLMAENAQGLPGLQGADVGLGGALSDPPFG